MFRKPWAFQRFSPAHGWSWGFAHTKLWHLWGGEKYDQRFYIETIHWEFKVSLQKAHTVPTPTVTQHAHLHIEYYSPRWQAVSTSHFRDLAQRKFSVSKAIFHLWMLIFVRWHHFSTNYQHFRLQLPWSENLGPSEYFSSAHGWSWGFAYTKLWHLWGVEKYNQRFWIETTHTEIFAPKKYT